MDKTIKTWMNILLFIFLMLVLSFVVSLNIENNKDILLILSTFLIVSTSIRYLFFYESPRFYNLGFVSILFDAVIVFFMNNLDKYKIAKIFYLVLAGDSILFYPIAYGLILTAFSYGIYLFNVYGASRFLNFREFLPEVLSSLAALIFIIVVMVIVKYVIKQHSIINKTMEELSKVNMRLEENSNLLQQMAVVKERNRIASEIHDTVGHTLTTVLVEIQAGKRVLKKDSDTALQKLDLAEMQVRNGLCDIMKSVKLINDGSGSDENSLSIIKLIDETKNHAGIKISYKGANISFASKEIQKVIYKALKEGLTNGLRHGKSTEFEFELIIKNNFLLFTLTDNGSGCERFEPGFGIQSITGSVKELGGEVGIDTNAGRGFRINLKIPLERLEADE